MACQANSGRISQLAGRVSSGISQLSSKQAFFIGLALGASGTGGVLLASNLLRRSKAPRQALTINGQPANGVTPTKKQPKPIPVLAGGRPKAKPIPGLSEGRVAKPIPVLATSPITLQAAAVEIKTGSGEPFLAENSYRVLRPNGSDTGLALTPYLASDQTNGQADAWGVTHTGSGALVDGPYHNVDQAQGLAAKLSNLPWTGAISKQDIGQAQRIVQAHRKSLEREDQ